MNKIKLKPCPFCGSKNIKLYHTECEVNGECQNCGASSGYRIFWGKKPTKEEAAEAWNRRADNG